MLTDYHRSFGNVAAYTILKTKLSRLMAHCVEEPKRDGRTLHLLNGVLIITSRTHISKARMNRLVVPRNPELLS